MSKICPEMFQRWEIHTWVLLPWCFFGSLTISKTLSNFFLFVFSICSGYLRELSKYLSLHSGKQQQKLDIIITTQANPSCSCNFYTDPYTWKVLLTNCYWKYLRKNVFIHSRGKSLHLLITITCTGWRGSSKTKWLLIGVYVPITSASLIYVVET